MIHTKETATKELQTCIEDNRYTIQRENTGLALPTRVVRFCDNFIGQGETVDKAILQAVFHQGERMGLL